MNYEFLGRLPNGDFRYKVSFNLFRDALNSEIPFADELELGVYLNNDNKSITAIEPFKLVSQFEVPAPGSIDCDYYKKNVRIYYGLYEGIIVLKPSQIGYHLTFVQCCRNEQNNLIQGDNPTQGQTYYCFIPATSFENSSPSFYGVPSPYMCASDTTSFLFDAIDKDGDSLVYEIMRPFGGGTTGNSTPVPEDNLELKQLIYAPGYSHLEPFGENGYISVDPSTGRTLMYAPEPGRYVVGVQVTEYRNGQELSTVRMDLQIDVLNCIPNKPPNISSGDGKRFEIEEGEELCFIVEADDPEADIVRLSGRGVILGDGDTTGITQGTFEDKAAVAEVSSEFCWVPGCDLARDNPYYVYFTVEDNGCPPKFNHLDVEIKVIPFQGAEDLNGPTNVCQYNEYTYTLSGGGNGSSYAWILNGGYIVNSETDSTVTIHWEETGTQTIEAREVSGAGCLGDWVILDVEVNSSPELPIINGRDTICENELSVNYSLADDVTYSYNWMAMGASGTANRNEFIITSYNVPNFTLGVIATNAAGCPSDTGMIDVFVSMPNPSILGPDVVCPNADGMMYFIDPSWVGSTYNWNITGGTQSRGGTTEGITVDWGNEGLGQIAVIETDRFGCVSPQAQITVEKSYDLGFLDLQGFNDVCEFEQAIDYEAIESNGSIFRWTIDGGIQASGDSSNKISVDWGVQGNGSVNVFQYAFDDVNNRECIGQETELPVVIHPNPIANEIQGNMGLCQFTDTIEYSILGFPNSTFEWTVGGSSMNIIGQGTNTIKVVWNQPGTFNITAIETSEFDCLGELIDTQVIVHPKPQTSIILGDSIICPENALNLGYSVTGFANSTFNWFADSAIDLRNNGTSSIEVDWDTDKTFGRISVAEVSEHGCIGDTQSIDIEFDNLEIDLRFVSVGSPDDRMELEWELVKPAETNSFTISKKIAGSTDEFSAIASVSGNEFNYIESNINTDLTAFEYTVSSTNKCRTRIVSEPHTNILLEAEKDLELNTDVIFSEYYGWENGVLNYDLWTSDNENVYFVYQFGAIPNQNQIITFNPELYRKCYRVYAEENGGDSTTSWSNEVCVFFSPQVFIPNAFTPNGDQLNDGFGVKGIAVNEFNIQIFNRWGEKVYESSDIDAKWEPIYQGTEVQMGTYMYLINFTDGQDKPYIKSGTINLIR